MTSHASKITLHMAASLDFRVAKDDGSMDRLETSDTYEKGVDGQSNYRENSGLKYPTEIVQKRAGWPVFDLQVLAAWPNPAKLATLMAAPAAAAGGGGPPAPAPIESEKLADGVYRIKGDRRRWA